MRTPGLLVFACLCFNPAVHADCRAQLRPLLLDAGTTTAAVESVRSFCEAEAAAGDADALYQLALMDLGLAGRWETATAIPRIRSAAEQGITEAQYWLAWQHESGSLLPQDNRAALDWYRRAADGGHRLAIGRLADAYESGQLGLAPDPSRALHYRALQSQCARGKGTGS